MQPKKRLTYLDMSKGCAIACVVIVHALGALMKLDEKPFMEPVMVFLAQFAIALFFIISGMIIKVTKEEEKDFLVILKRKAKTIFLPFCAFSMTYAVVHIGIRQIEGLENASHSFSSDLLHFFSLRGMSVLWFFPTLFVGELYFLILRKKCKGRFFDVIMVLSGIIILFLSPVMSYPIWLSTTGWAFLYGWVLNLCRSILTAFFLWIGYSSITWLRELNKRYLEFVVGILLFSIAALFSRKVGGVDVNHLVFENRVGYILGSVAASFGIIFICKNIKESRLLTWLGENSIIIMVTHLDFLVLGNAMLIAFALNQYITRARVLFLYFNIFVLFSLFEYIWIFVFNKYLYFLLGRSKK